MCVGGLSLTLLLGCESCSLTGLLCLGSVGGDVLSPAGIYSARVGLLIGEGNGGSGWGREVLA